ncbi:MAG: glycosyltransferase family 39 protein, partial [Chloroflexota bacterium]
MRSIYVDWVLGLGAALVLLLWLALPSRLPALGWSGLVVVGSAARLYALYPVRMRTASRTALRVVLTVENGALALALLLAFGLRFAGLSQSLPYFDNPDEPTMVNGALKMVQTGDFNPHYFRWPSLPIYLQFVISVPTFFAGVSNATIKSLSDIPTENFFLAGRVMSAALGVATVFLTFLIGRRLYGARVGLLAAVVLAVLPLHSEHSHYVTPDIMVTFFATLTLLFAVYIYQTGAKHWYWWAGIAVGLTLGSKYNVAVVFLTVLLAHFLTPRLRRGRWTWLVGSGGMAVLTFLFTTPFALFDLPGFLNEMA